MLSKEDNELLHRVGPGTVMGDLFRQYWLPALMSEELAGPDSDPVRVRLLGENLIAFRQTDGQIGLVQQACPHRCASLFYGRNEENGLRCVYHGWKFDVDGRCVDMPSEPAESNFKDKIRITAYPCLERNGVVWAYLGPRSTPPPLPDLEVNVLPGARISLSLRSCNWMQALEGDIDTAHLGFLHMGSVTPDQTPAGTFNYYNVKERTPRYEVVDTDYGTLYGAYRPTDDGQVYWRFAAFLFPFYTMIPTGLLGLSIGVRPWAPIDDDHTMVWGINDPGAFNGIGGGSSAIGAAVSPPRNEAEYLPNSSDWLGRWRYTQRAENDYLIDRAAQRNHRSYTGIAGINQQDQAITESMGALTDRTQEHLGTSDAMIIRTRQRLLRAAKALRESGTVPPGVDDPTVYHVRTGGIYLPKDADWLAATEERRKAFVEHPGLREEAQSGKY